MTGARRLATIALALLLSGCWWEGPPFYKGDPNDAGPVAPGWYRVDVLGQNAAPIVRHVEWLPDGRTRTTPRKVTRDDGIGYLVTKRLDLPGRHLWIIQSPAGDEPGAAATYGLVERHGLLLDIAFPIDCDSSVEIVKAAGGTVSGGDQPVIVDTRPATTRHRAGRAAPIPPAAPMAEANAPAGPLQNQHCSFADRPSLERALVAYAKAHPHLDGGLLLRKLSD
ncbi:hypothetical protein U1839_14900 [Sphingomonas sp. RT2P30]|uniref:hypothetical protein n=1 Tax=Parasphingomonas halimpatiens TaxID=3096162 RepID=UPI002FCBA83F